MRDGSKACTGHPIVRHIHKIREAETSMDVKNKVERPEWVHEYMRHVGGGQWVCDGCPLESCDCDKGDGNE